MKIINPTKQSRKVTLFDIPRVLWDSIRIKIAMLKPFPGKFPFASSLSHCQIESNDPLRFFVVDKEGGLQEKTGGLRYAIPLKKFFGARTIINPVIVKHGDEIIKSLEGCMSEENKHKRRVKRYENIIVNYWTFFGRKTRKFSLYRAILIQHEIDHADGISIEDRFRHSI